MSFHPSRTIRQLCCTNYLVFVLVHFVWERTRLILELWLPFIWRESHYQNIEKRMDWKHFSIQLWIVIKTTYAKSLMPYSEWKGYKIRQKMRRE